MDEVSIRNIAEELVADHFAANYQYLIIHGMLPLVVIAATLAATWGTLTLLSVYAQNSAPTLGLFPLLGFSFTHMFTLYGWEMPCPFS